MCRSYLQIESKLTMENINFSKRHSSNWINYICSILFDSLWGIYWKNYFNLAFQTYSIQAIFAFFKHFCVWDCQDQRKTQSKHLKIEYFFRNEPPPILKKSVWAYPGNGLKKIWQTKDAMNPVHIFKLWKTVRKPSTQNEGHSLTFISQMPTLRVLFSILNITCTLVQIEMVSFRNYFWDFSTIKRYHMNKNTIFQSFITFSGLFSKYLKLKFLLAQNFETKVRVKVNVAEMSQ